tara:strand:- start:2345 stop:2539 length:195 start_codon:yes stop_codon:yes gene_type:complete
MLLHSVEWMGYHADVGALAIVVRVYDRTQSLRNIYDCRIKMICGAELDCWFGEIHILVDEHSYE